MMTGESIKKPTGTPTDGRSGHRLPRDGGINTHGSVLNRKVVRIYKGISGAAKFLFVITNKNRMFATLHKEGL